MGRHGGFAEECEIASCTYGSVGNDVAWPFADLLSDSQVIRITMGQKAGCLDECLLRREMAVLGATEGRLLGQSDEEYANFRKTATTGIKPVVQYRSSSPVNDWVGRSKAADYHTRSHAIGHLINLYDTRAGPRRIPAMRTPMLPHRTPPTSR